MRLFVIVAALAAGLLALSPAKAASDNCPLLGVYNSDNVTLQAGQQACGLGGTNIGATFHPMGAIYTTTATAGTATGTSEQTLGTFSLPANALDVAGRRIRIKAMFSKAANTDGVTGRLYFGSEVISTGSNITSGAGMALELDIVKTGSSTQIVWGAGQQSTTLITPYSAAGAETDTSAITIKATCQDGTSAANDCVLQDFAIEYLN